MNEIETVLAVTQSDSLEEALEKLQATRNAVASGHVGPLDGVEAWESPGSALARLDNEIKHVEDLLLEQQIDRFEAEQPKRKRKAA